jgi:hypothetical protein
LNYFFILSLSEAPIPMKDLRNYRMNSSPLRQYFATYVMFLLAFTIDTFGQAPGTGAISGLVTDASNGEISHAEVEAVNEATHASRSVFTSADGVFRVPLLLPGSYTVTVKAMGFAPLRSQPILVTVSETTTINLTVAVAGVGTTLQVNAEEEMVQQESSTLGRAVEQEAIEALPLANRNFTQILGLSPGVVVALPDATELGRGTQNVTSNGAKTTSKTSFSSTACDANNLSQNSAANDGEEVGVAIPAPDAIQEFKVQTANYDAAYGRGAGANVDLVSRSGANRLHGSAWEFVRNNIFNANDFFLKLDGQPRPTLKQNQFGASIGGPIRRDKTFFFGEYQGLTSSNGAGSAVTTLLPQLTSDRSAATLGAQFCPAGHANSGGYLTNAGGAQVALRRIEHQSGGSGAAELQVQQRQLRDPQSAGEPAFQGSDQLPVGQSTYAIPAFYKENQFSVNLDQVFTDKNTFAGGFSSRGLRPAKRFLRTQPTCPAGEPMSWMRMTCSSWRTRMFSAPT